MGTRGLEMKLYLVILIFLFRGEISHCLITGVRFYQGTICNIQERVEKECSREILRDVRGRFECLGICSRYESCVGASIDDVTGKCYIHRECLIPSKCDVIDRHDYYWHRHYCINGLWDETTRSCECQYAAKGDRCEKCVRSCHALINREYEEGTYEVCLDPDEDDLNTFVAKCHIVPRAGTANLMVAENKGGKMTFNRTWYEYENGFSDDTTTGSGSYWVGLEVWHALSSVYNYKERFYIKLENNKNGPYCFFYDFVIGNKDSGYAMKHDGDFYCQYGNCLASLTNVPFSTFDRDRDNAKDVNCASVTMSGWWFNECDPAPCNLLGGGVIDKDWASVPDVNRFRWIKMPDSTWQSDDIEAIQFYFVDFNY